jgi:RHS repeat-associated protein
MDSTATTFQLGDDASNRQYRAILSFDTRSLPPNAVIQSAQLRIKKSGAAVGTNPFAILGKLLVDIHAGKFGSAYALQLGDFQAASSADKVAYFDTTSGPVNGWYSTNLNAAAFGFITGGDKTQLRLRFTKSDNGDHGADFIKFLSGNAASGKPQLVISYTLSTPTVTPTQTPTPNLGPTPTLAPFSGATYLYDGDGNLVKSTVNGVISYFPSKIYIMINGVVQKYYSAGSQTVAMRTGGTLYYLLSDQLGSTSLTLDAGGQLVSELRYKAFGEIRYAVGNTPTDYRYTGQLQQADIGLYYYNARWYDPYLNHFTQPDSIVSGGVQGLDRYAYVNNNPLLYS